MNIKQGNNRVVGYLITPQNTGVAYFLSKTIKDN